MVGTMETGFYPHMMPKGTLFLIVLQQIQLETAIENCWPQPPKDYYKLQFFLTTNYADYTNFCRVPHF
jgi:hypothetical protein